MTDQEYEDHFAALLKANVMRNGKVYNAIAVEDVPAHVKRAVKFGLAEFWGAFRWEFKLYLYTFPAAVIATAADSYALPNNFESFVSLRDHTDTNGVTLHYLEPEEFERLVENDYASKSGAPSYYTVVRDANTGIWKIRFDRQPSGRSLTALINITTPSSVAQVPDQFQSGVKACVAKHVFPHGHPSHREAMEEAEYEIMRLKVVDTRKQSSMTHFADTTRLHVTKPYDFI